ncbi:MAG: STAS domain-containing protein [Anaerolineae bacterium]|jgi:anti-anti-sigma factor
MLDISTRNFKRTSVVTASGRVDSATAPQLEEAFEALTDESRYRIVFDMGDVDFISSVGLRVLVDTKRVCRRNNRGDLALANVSEEIKRTLELAGFYTLFNVYDSTVEAVGSI